MKKTIYMLTLLLLGITAMGDGLSQLTLSISTEGPDYYADGTAVQTGERYLLVYVEKGADFAGVKTDGTLVDTVNNTVVTESVAIEGSKCRPKGVQHPPEMYPEGGQFLIVLLDTRNAAGAVGGLVSKVGIGGAKDATSGSLAESSSSVGVAATTADGGPALVADTLSVSPPTPEPKITSIQGAGENISLTIGNVIKDASYEVETTTDIGSGEWTAVKNGARLSLSATDSEQTKIPTKLKVEQNDKVRFFRVISPSKN